MSTLIIRQDAASYLKSVRSWIPAGAWRSMTPKAVHVRLAYRKFARVRSEENWRAMFDAIEDYRKG